MIRLAMAVICVVMVGTLGACGVGDGAGTPVIPQLTNNSFETGDFTGWVTKDLTRPLTPLSVTTGSAATEGMYGVRNGFDGDGGVGMDNQHIYVAQDIDLTGIFLVAVRFDWHVPSCDVFGMEARQFSVVLEPAGGGTPIATFPIHTCPIGAITPGGPVAGEEINISAYANQPLRIKFQWYVPEDFTGPALAYLDNVSLFRPATP